MFPGLQNLHVGIKQDCSEGFALLFGMLKDGSLPLWENDLVQFRNSMLRRVTVIVDDEDGCPMYHRGWTFQDQEYLMNELGHWTIAEKADFAELLKQNCSGNMLEPPLRIVLSVSSDCMAGLAIKSNGHSESLLSICFALKFYTGLR